ncbi:hypothetical protein HQN60_08720 [Deefgea piscis]|uniref:Uncharacterized protein n=1 Tax=Deefgea piscis TaxID=2739061 RepID=A0A6M8STL6_9NEIS|nr:hypothetical protein [Deefgea piscis]QKJ66776.1 hypothetical protein HQN60_08720 [Deefgea piscis]
MNLATAKTIVTHWDQPIIRQLFWYLIIPAYVEIQRADPATFAYRNAKGFAYRWLFLWQLVLSVLILMAVNTISASWPSESLAGHLLLIVKLINAYFIAMYGVWALAYWSMKIPR